MTGSLHRLLCRLLPRDFRRAHGADMEEVFREALEVASRRGMSTVLRLWLREAVDLAATGHRLRSDARRFGADFVTRGVSRRSNVKRGGMTMGIMDDFRYAARSLVRRPSLTVFAALTLALGIGSTTAIFSTLESVVLNPLPYENGDRMVGVFKKIGSANAFITPNTADLELWQEQSDLFEALEPWTFTSMTLTGRGEPREVQVAMVRAEFFEMLGRSPTIGRAFGPDDFEGEGAPVVMLSDAFWRRDLGGIGDPLGQTVALHGVSRTVVGVLPPRTHVPGFGLMTVDFWLPLPASRRDSPMPVTGVLREGVTVEQVNERLAALAPETAGSFRSFGHATLVSERVGGGVRSYLQVLMGAVVLLLLIACVNVSNLLLFRADARKRETALRAALGGGRARLTRQLLIESLMLAVVGGVLGVALSYAGQAAIFQMRPSQLDVLDHVSINGRVLGFALLVTLGTGLLFGWLPAWTSSRPSALSALRSGSRSSSDVVGRRVRWLLVTGEVALSFALLIGSFSVLDALIERHRTDFGYLAEEIAVMDVQAPTWKYDSAQEREPVLKAIEERLERLPGAVHVARASGVPPRAGVWFGNLQVEGEEAYEETQILHGPHVDAEYFATLGQRLVRGRSFTPEDVERGAEDVIVIGEGTARTFFSGRDPVGARFRMDDDDAWMTVVGVAADVPMVGLGSGSAPHQFYRPMRDSWRGSTFLVRVAAGEDPAHMLPLMREIAGAVDADIRIDRLSVAADMMRETLERERFGTTLMAVLAALALLLAAVGLYGVVSQVVGQRTREIGIRIALGARAGTVAAIVLGRAGGATAAGIAAGVVLALAGSSFLEAKVFGLEATDPGTYVLAALALSLTALVAAYAPARRATQVDPVDAIRVE